MTTGLVIFAATYFLIAVQRLPFVHLNRPAASLLGAVAMVGFGVLPLPAAYAAIDFDVLVFLLGLMLIVGYLEVGRFFEWTAEWILQRALSPARLMLAVVVGGGLLSALFVNDTICLVVTPVLLAALGPLRVRPHPYLIGLAMGANVGSVLSITGNPQNMLVGIWSGASFGGFLAHMLPVGVGGLAITYGYLRWAYRADLREPFRERLEAVPVTLDRPLVLKALALFGVAVVAWLAGGSLPLVAITAGACMVAIAQRDPAYAIDRVEWSLLLFFASLFVVMRGFEQTGGPRLPGPLDRPPDDL
ncbi:MAG: anion transporter [Gemmatimonadetes bacterium]|nr:MAG: anion transporter [Gemmatimonadota bacterium]